MSIREKAAPGGVFLDRDGTIIDDVHYIARPELVRLRSGAGQAIARLNRAGIPVVVVTNQSGIARGVLTQADYERVHHRMTELLAQQEAHLDATYMCPHHPDYDGECECRKPGTLLFRRAAHEHALDLAHSTFIGDRWRDVAPGLALGGQGILIAGDDTRDDELAAAKAARVPLARSLADAVSQLLAAR